MLSILFEILTSDDMQDDTSEMLWFLLKYEEMAYCESFFVYALFYPMIYAPRFCQMKGLIKLCICGEFYQYSECGCEVKIFKVFWIDSDP